MTHECIVIRCDADDRDELRPRWHLKDSASKEAGMDLPGTVRSVAVVSK